MTLSRRDFLGAAAASSVAGVAFRPGELAAEPASKDVGSVYGWCHSGDGLKLWVATTDGHLLEYDLSQPFDMTTATAPKVIPLQRG